ncbi:MAG: nucleotidyltransferase family protein [Acidobacteriota bacterium]
MTDDTRWYLLFASRQEKNLVDAFNLLRSAGIEPILVKGWASARNYPETRNRYYTDIDLAVSGEQYDAAAAGIAESGHRLGIDLHRELRQLDTTPWEQLFVRSVCLNINGTPVRILCPEDHLRVICTHWLVEGGINKERLWDIYYAVESRPNDFDWERCLNAAGPIRRGWTVTAIGLAHQYLGLRIDDTPIRDEALKIPAWVIRTVEKEWSLNLPLIPLTSCLSDPKMLLRQLRKRIPPNPIQATVEMEGRFDDGARLKTQMSNVFQRIGPLFQRLFRLTMSK